MEQGKPQHFMVVALPGQGHINPALHLAERIASTTGARVTIFTSVSVQSRRMLLPSLPPAGEEAEDGLVSFTFFSDGYDDGFKANNDNGDKFMPRFEKAGSQSLSAVARDLAARGKPIICFIHTLLLTWVADIAHELGVPSALYWIQPATVFAVYYHYFHGYESLIAAHSKEPSFTVRMPGLSPFPMKDIPTFLTISNADDPYSDVLASFRELFEALDRGAARRRPKVLVNTFDALETDALAAIDGVELIAVGPLLPPALLEGKQYSKSSSTHEERKCMEWLDGREEGSVVYVSFGSFSVFTKRQLEEMSRGLSESGRPYLWVVRKDNREEGAALGEDVDGEKGMVVEWCSQLKVLSHRAVGCFVTHCGWNSTLESLACGVPTVGVPQWTEQRTNARLAESTWGTGITGAVNGEGFLEAAELVRCIDVVMGVEERGVEIRRTAAMWRDRAIQATVGGGPCSRNLKTFVDEMTR